MEIVAFDPHLEKDGWPEDGVQPVSDLGAALGWADYISVHVPKSDKPVIGAVEIAAHEAGRHRGQHRPWRRRREKALVEALESGQIGAAGLDVFEEATPGQLLPYSRTTT